MKTMFSLMWASAACVALAITASCNQIAIAAESTPLQAETPTTDNTPATGASPSSSDPAAGQGAAPSASRLHSLEINRNEMGEGVDANGPAGPYNLRLTPGQGNIQIHGLNTSGVSINIQPFNSRTTLNSGAASPFGLLQAMFGSNNKDMRKAYAECDTGYGVCGLALNMGLSGGFARINSVFPSMPAKEAGILPGDVVVSVNGKSTNDIAFSEVWDWFTGLPGTAVTLTISRNGEVSDITLKRMDIGRIPDFATRAGFLSLYRLRGASKFLQQQSYQTQP